jgi:lipoate-protein ligase A
MTTDGTTLLSADYKAPGGKLLRVRLREADGRIESAKISGDFFLIPEDSLPKLEMMLEDVPLREKELKLLVDRFFRGTSAQGLGVSPDDFVKAILAAKPGETGS